MIGAWLLAAYFAVATIPLAYFDLREHRLPNAWTLPAWALAVVALAADWIGTGRFPVDGALAAGVALVLFGMFAVFAGLGMGDVKLAVPLAAGLGLAGPGHPVVGLAAAFVLGGLAAAIVLVRTRDRHAHLAFGPWLLAGYWLGLLV